MIIEFNNTQITPFLNKTSPSLFTLSPQSKVCLVGNSGLMLTKKWGGEIDNYDVVIRFNHAPTKGFEEYVGTKTTLRLVNGHCFGGLTDPQRNPTANPNFLPNLPPQDIICKTWNVEEFMKGVFNNINKHNLFFINPQFANEVSQYTQGQEPTAGFIMLMLMLSCFKKINIYGFTFWEDNYEYHYFEKVPFKSNQLGHNFNNEKEIITQLEQENKIKVYR